MGEEGEKEEITYDIIEGDINFNHYIVFLFVIGSLKLYIVKSNITTNNIYFILTYKKI